MLSRSSVPKNTQKGNWWLCNLVPRGPFCHAMEISGPLARPNDIPILNGCVNTIDWDQNQSNLSDLSLSMRRVTGSPWIADFRSWTWPEVAIPVANQKKIAASGNEIDGYATQLRSAHAQLQFSNNNSVVSILIFLWKKRFWLLLIILARGESGVPQLQNKDLLNIIKITSEYMKVHIFELRRMKWNHDWSSQLYTQLKQLRN